MTFRTLFLFAVLLAAGGAAVHGQNQASRRPGGANELFAEREFRATNGQTLRYSLFVPALRGTDELPLVLCLHGSGGNTAAANMLASPEMQKKNSCVVMAPACDSKTSRWAEGPS